jgi:hypothetical protein
MNLEKNFRVFLDLLNSNKFYECIIKLKIEKKLFPSPLYENLHGIILAKKNLIEDAKVQFLSTIEKYPDFPDAVGQNQQRPYRGFRGAVGRSQLC